MADKKVEEYDEVYRDTTIIAPAWAMEPVTYCQEYLANKGLRVTVVYQGKPGGGGGCTPTPGHPCP